MDERKIAERMKEMADLKGGSVFAGGDLSREEIHYAVERGWLEPVGIGHFKITPSGRSAPS
jgi:hypothetical protein